MKVTLVMNPDAGDGGHDRDDMADALGRRGDEIHAIGSDHLEGTLADPGDLVVVAGGDGTVSKVVRTLVGREVPILIVPAGTANNIARSLGIEKRQLDLDRIRRDWRPLPIDVALCDGQVIIESAGCGAIAHLIRREPDTGRKGPKREAKSLGDDLDTVPAFDYRITTGDRELCGAAIVIEAMVMSQIGPNLSLAPDVDPADGLLDLIVAKEEHRADLRRYLDSGAHRRRLPDLRLMQGTEFTIACDAPWHFDDEPTLRRTRTITLRRAAWSAMVPKKR
jgi:diacylglycerol kinase family enzyme